MQMYPPEFPLQRRNVRVRQAERRVFRSLVQSRAPGFPHYEWQRKRRDGNAIQLDFALWLKGTGRFGLQVKGGHYILREGIWYRRKSRRGGYVKVAICPLGITSDSTMSLRDELFEAEGYSSFVIPVLIFPDMEPDEAISNRAERTNVHLVWGTDRLIPRLNEIAREVRVWHPPHAGDIRREVAVITDGQIKYRIPPDSNGRDSCGGSAGAQGNGAAPATVSTVPDLVIPHVRQVHLRLE